jgi:D-alanyl-D-alanine carboxypeptidase
MRVVVGLVSAAALAVGVNTPAHRTVVNDAVEMVVRAGFPGAIGYSRIGDERRHAAAGLGDIERQVLARSGDRFRIASNTKAFTAAVVLQLVGEKRLALDVPVSRWLPRVPAGITVRQLLDHSSGLYDPTKDPAFWEPYFQGNRGFVYRPADLVATAVRHPLGEPDYSNTNYLVLGLLIEKVTGRSAVSEMYRRILVPLNLVRTSFPTVDPTIHGRHLHGYAFDGTDLTVFSPSYDWTAGAMISTVDDLAKFHRALFNGLLLRPAELAELRTGLGVERLPLPCGEVWTTTGGGPGYNSVAVTSADTSRQLVLAMNRYDIEADVAEEPPVHEVELLPLLTEFFC